MSILQITTSSDRFLVSLDRKVLKRESLLRLLEMLRLKMLTERVDFDASMDDLGEKIKADWWEKNKETYLRCAQ